ncbi:SpoIIE family protein phosphatase [Marinobacter sp. chi1]|uniref:SpoIIE family protein phosphatase n=1 Tax=Marinobacter suaedae TaxID=3057675 RepID=A0ABT8W217_9GAMM|nr:SpoIIE family protein phosphatase [Marinobacter sp. chi1]MDO3722265.1 SpoIIE family protein phosphatase [Marinobacter sp. chi1]
MTSRTERILIIDADQHARTELARYLEARGFYVTGCADFGAAQTVFSEGIPDVIFVDVPPATIRELARIIEESESLTPIVCCSESSSSADVVAALRAGAADFLLKPCNDDKAALDDVIEKLFDRVRVNRLNQLYRQELEEANRELRNGIAELRADQRAGRKVQLKMLPDREQDIEGLHVEHLIKPSLYLSGDFLDYFPITENQVLVYIADVSGHGASSAFVTVLLKNLTNRLQRNLRRGSSDDILYPERFLQRINSELLDTGLGKHVTVFVGIITLSERKLRYAVGAHFPMPILSFEEGSTAFLEGRGLPVGLFEDPEWDVYEASLDKPFRLILFSDGILEVIRAKSLDDKEKTLLELVSSGRHTIASLSEALNLDDITELPDDIAIVSVTDTASESDSRR